MKQLLILLVSCFISSLMCGQETFFNFLTQASRSYYVVESDTGFVVAGTATIGGSNAYQFHELALNGDLESDWSFEVDTALSTEQFRGSYFASDLGGAGVHSVGQLVNQQVDNYGSYFKFKPDFSDTLRGISLDIGLESSFQDGIEISADSLVLIGVYQTVFAQNEILILCMDTLGTIHWQNNIAFPGEDVFPIDIHTHPAGGYVLTAQEYMELGGGGVNEEIHSVVYRLDELGDVMWSRRPGNDEEFWTVPGGSLVLPNGNILSICTEQRIIQFGQDQLNPIRTLEWSLYDEAGLLLDEGDYLGEIESEVVGTQGYRYTAYGLLNWQDGNVIIYGNNLREGFILKVTPQGEYVWHQTYSPVADIPNDPDFSRMHIYGLYPASDGGFLGTGEFRADPGSTWPNGIQTSFLLKVDSMGCLEPADCDIVDGLWEWESEQPKGELKVYPNPATDYFTADYRILEDFTSARMLVTDAMGRVVQEYPIEAARDQVLFSLPELSGGRYDCILMVDGKVYASTELILAAR